MQYKFPVLMFCAFLGGMSGSILMTATPSLAAKAQSLFTTNFFNDNKERIAVIGAHPGGEGTLFLFDGKGKTEIMMGAYPSGAEKGQSMIGMHDRNNHMRFLLRMYGAKDSPTMIMKDSAGRDRIVFGLDANSEKPYFMYSDDSGRMRNLLQ